MLRALAWTGKTQFGDYITQLDTDPGVWESTVLAPCHAGESVLSFPMMVWYLVYRKERNKSGISLTALPLGILRNPVTEMISMTFLGALTWKRLL